MTESSIQQIVRAFFSQYRMHTYAKGDILLRPGGEKKRIFFLQSGHVEQYVTTIEGTDLTLTIYKPKAFFPMAWITDNANIYTLKAMDQVSVRIAPYEDVVQFLEQDPDVLFDLLRRVYRGMAGLLIQAEQLMSGSAKKRLVTSLIISAKRFGLGHKHDIHILLKLSHQDIAALTGLTRETVSRLMAEFKKAGVLSYTRGTITVKNIADLEKELL